MHIKRFSELSAADSAVAGGKGASLAEMTNAGLPVPQGFVVLSSAFERFLQENKLERRIQLEISKVDLNDTAMLSFASETIQGLITACQMPADLALEIKSAFKALASRFVAVRSSATAEDSSSAAWAGQLDTYLNTTEDNLLENVRRCWASLFTQRAIFYRLEKGLRDQRISVAVVVQGMIESETSGIAFSVHPVTQDRNQLVIEAGFGLGEAIVSGQITPDNYVVDKHGCKITEKTVSEQRKKLVRSSGGGNEWQDIRAPEQKLSDKQIIELAKIIITIEKHYGFPVDVEWAYANGKFFITQARPITTLSTGAPEFELEFQREVAIPLYYLWFYGHCSVYELLGMDTSIADSVYAVYEDGIAKGYTQNNNIDIIKEAISKKDAVIRPALEKYDRQFAELKKKPDLTLDKQFMTELVAGFIITFILGDMPDHPLQPTALELRKKTELLFPMINDALQRKTQDFSLYTYDELVEHKHVPAEELQIRRRSILRRDGVKSSIVASVQDQPGVLYLHYFSRDFCLPYIEAWCRGESTDPRQWTEKQQPVKPYIVFERAPETVHCYMDPAGVDWIKQELQKLCADKDYVKDLVKRFYKLCEWCMPVWNEERTLSREDLVRFIDELRIEWPPSEAVWWLMEILPQDSEDFKLVQQARVDTERGSAGGDIVIRKSLEQIYPELGDLSAFLLTEEVRTNKLPDLSILQARSKHYYYTQAKLFTEPREEIERIYSIKLEKLENLPTNEFSGEPAYKGRVSGTVRRVVSRNDIPKVEEGEILVAPVTTPDYVPALRKAAAFITDEGGITSHAAIASREMKKPCVTGTKIATHVLQDGDVVEVDGFTGVVRIIEKLSKKYELYIKRDFCLAMLELWHYVEAERTVPYIHQKIPYRPYILFERSEGTVASYYNVAGMRWIKKQLVQYFRRHPVGMPDLIKKLDEGLTSIQPIYDNPRPLSREKLLRFIDDFEKICPYSVVMWLLCGMEESDLEGLDIKSLQDVRARTDKLSSGTDQAIRMSLAAFYPQFSQHAAFLTLAEIRSQRLPGKAELERRDAGFCWLEGEFLTRSEAEARYHISLPVETVSRRELKGTTAFPGRVRGTVRRVMGHKQLDSMQQGEILVSPMTMPDFLPAMKKAAAIVTDEGGLTCHAAIVARELKIPCIVGMRHATTTLVDGDLVEVDASNATVKLLDKPKLFPDMVPTFWTQGVTFLFTDTIKEMYYPLTMVLSLRKGMYVQYFSKQTLEQSSRIGVEFYSNPERYAAWRAEIMTQVDKVDETTKELKSEINKETASRAIENAKKLVHLYSLLDFEYTDRTFAERKTNGCEKQIEDAHKLKDVIRKRMEDVFFADSSHVAVICDELSKRFSVPKEELAYYAAGELLQLFDGEKVDERILSDRKEYAVFICSPGNNTLLTGKEAAVAFAELETTFTPAGEIKGVCASKGKAKGVVKVIMQNYSDKSELNRKISEMKQGAILVADSTAPDVMLACKKAAAIVTDIGGSMSHAAIVSRELGIPCVVGTVSGTKALHDGDLVEVDATNGIVRKL